ncbi:MAG: RagB/SusD family nutrient uptake outer membrane protein [Carboxylicivirga sp.]|jgi:hypothetical protein|nr:RagB/SusD family nutrient uptake outer membrane protein [Carboxylicivirga sp.]MCT4645952.1 RagB/SusD family nutrient uptake outer membrane protein [Carboxylicivirga sp.]
MKLKYFIAFSSVMALLLSSCNKLELAPTDKFTEANYWTSVDKAQMVLNSA